MDSKIIKIDGSKAKFFTLVKTDDGWKKTDPKDSIKGEYKGCYLKKYENQYGVKTSIVFKLGTGNDKQLLVEGNITGAVPSFIASLYDRDCVGDNIMFKMWKSEKSGKHGKYTNGMIWIDFEKAKWNMEFDEMRELRDEGVLREKVKKVAGYEGVRNNSGKAAPASKEKKVKEEEDHFDDSLTDQDLPF